MSVMAWWIVGGALWWLIGYCVICWDLARRFRVVTLGDLAVALVCGVSGPVLALFLILERFGGVVVYRPKGGPR